MELKVRNVNSAFAEIWWKFKVCATPSESRNGPVLRIPEPVTITYTHPTERILWNRTRDANPVFHLMEAVWMLSGREDVGFLLPFNARMREYAEIDDDGKPAYIHGAYGYRWRKHFGFDQLERIVDTLRRSPESRQAVLGMWSPADDLVSAKLKDGPWNTHVYFEVYNGKLNMTVCNRSNDVLWGALGANAVHFSMLQEVVARGLGVPVGEYRQFTNNLHAYVESPAKVFLDNPMKAHTGDDRYSLGDKPTPLFQPGETMHQFLTDCVDFCANPHSNVLRTRFFNTTVQPLRHIYMARKIEPEGWKDIQLPIEGDWENSFCDWADRREEKQ
jgi:hypothetical protein